MKSVTTQLALLVSALVHLSGCIDAADATAGEPVSASARALEVGDIVVYQAGRRVPEAELAPLDPADFGGQILDGDATWSGRIDLLEDGLIGGVFQATRGTYSVVYPGTVHGTILFGHVEATALGTTYHLHSGDSFLVTRGTEVVFETLGASHQASFLGNFASPDMPGQFFVHERGSAADPDDLVFLGGPEDFNATALEGDPIYEARIDHAADFELGGIFRATRGTVLVHGITSTEHVTNVRHRMTITANGVRHTLRPGDSYLVQQGTQLITEVQSPAVEQSFLAVFGP